MQDTSSAGPILSKRALESSVVVDDQQIVVLGGLIQDSLSDGTQKLPYAGDVPRVRIAVPLRQPQRHEDEPDDLPEADDRARHERRAARSRRSATTTCAASRWAIAPDPRWFWKDPTTPELPPPGTMPGQAVPPAPISSVPAAGAQGVAPAAVVTTPAPAAPAPQPK